MLKMISRGRCICEYDLDLLNKIQHTLSSVVLTVVNKKRETITTNTFYAVKPLIIGHDNTDNYALVSLFILFEELI